MICPHLLWLRRFFLNRSLLTAILITCNSRARAFGGTTSRSLSHTDSLLQRPSRSLKREIFREKKEMVFLQTPGAGRGRPNRNFSSDASSSNPASRERGGGGGFRRKDVPQTDAPVIAELSLKTLHHMFTAEETRITDFEHLASYNWLDDRNPTIAVPGK